MSCKPRGEPQDMRVRIDKWLWAARFYKTRSLASGAVQGGKVHLNGHRVKAARPVAIGDRIAIRKGDIEFRIEVRALSERRGPAREAQRLYEEEAGSIQARQSRADERRLETAQGPVTHGRPDKKARRQWQKIHQR